MKIAVINEVSCADRNKDIINALEGFGHEIVNAGMKETGGSQELTYIETGLLGAILLNTKRVDFVVGGCGTGQGFLNSIMQYPNVFGGLIIEPIDAWLFSQINGGNCISLALNKGYGWAADVNLKFIFEKLFSVEFGCGYPEYRRDSQRESRKILCSLSQSTHLPFHTIIESMDKKILERVLKYDGVTETINVRNLKESRIKDALLRKFDELGIRY